MKEPCETCSDAILSSCRDCKYIKLVDKDNKYRWHDLRKDLEDLPEKTGLYLVFGLFARQISMDDFCQDYGYETIVFNADRKEWFDGECIAWREIEPFEGSEE